MFCAKCGAEMKPTDAFCLKCGAENKSNQAAPAQPAPNPAPVAPRPVQYAPPVAPAPAYRSAPAAPAYPGAAPAYTPAAKPNKKKSFILIGAAALASILLIVLIACNVGPKAAARRMMRAYTHLNGRKIIRLLPEELVDEEDIDVDDVYEELEDLDDELRDEYGDNYRLSFKILGTEKITGKDFRHLRDNYEEYYDMDGDRITAAKRVFVLQKVKGSEDMDYATKALILIKYNGHWYVMNLV